MSIADRIMKLFQVEIPLNAVNVAHALRRMAGEDKFKTALRHLSIVEERLVLEQYDKEELIQMMLDASLPADKEVEVQEFFDTYVKPTMGSIGEFIEYLDEKLPNDLRS